MTVQDWSTYLDDLEQSIAAQLQQVTVPEPIEVLSVPDATPPAGIGPLPELHRARAVDLLAQLEVLQTELRRGCDRTGRALSASRRVRRTIATPASSYVDSYS
jgi:hypothetical protein